MEADIRSFLSYLRVEKGLSDNTLYAYQRDMLKFAEFTGQTQSRHGSKSNVATWWISCARCI